MAKHYISNTISALTGIYLANNIIDIHAKRLSEKQKINGEYYDSRIGKIFYRVKGHGSPVLLIHNLGHRSASYEWDNIVHYISKEHTVYYMDLPGCGRSDKPKCIYTAYLYVQLLRDFVTDVIKESPTIIASSDSAAFTVMANSMEKNLFTKLILINPTPITDKNRETDKLKLAYMKFLFTPIVGTALYNIENISYNIFRPASVKSKLSMNSLDHNENAYISSHLSGSNGRFLRGSKINNFTYTNIKPKLKETNNVSLLISVNHKNANEAILSYTLNNKNITIIEIDSQSEFPHLDYPGKTFSALKHMIG